MAHIHEAELLEWVDGLTEVRRIEIDAHLLACSACRVERDRLVDLLDGIRAPDPRSEKIDLVRRVHRARLAPPRRSFLARHPQALAAAAGALAAGLLFAIFAPLADRREEFRSKAVEVGKDSRWTGVQAFTAKDSQEVTKLGPHLGKDALMFTYSNRSQEPYTHLMIFGVDSTSEVRWYYPAYTAPGTDPSAIPIAAGETAIPLPERVEHDLPAGRFIIYGLFLRRPLTVSAVEARARELAREGRFASADKEAPALLIAEDAFEQRLITDVE